jgi:hypothetical protein
MTDISHMEIPENAVIIIRDFEWPDDDSETPPLVAELHERFPGSLVIWLDSNTTFETMSEEHLTGLLQDLIDHQEAR